MSQKFVKRGLAAVAVVAVAGLALAGCASAPGAASSSAAAASLTAVDGFLPCMVSDAGGFDDKSFNQLGYEGLQEAAAAYGVTPITLESSSESDYANNINTLISKKCSLIVTVGFALSAATVDAAKANPKVDFAIIDDAADNDYDGKTDAPNIKPILFDTAQAAFLAGYAAADTSKTKVVGTFGGAQYPTVTIFMDGFRQGVEYYNKQKSASVKVVGWDGKTGVFTGGFVAGSDAKAAAQGLIDQNADVILPVGGPIYQSAAQAIEAANKTGKSISMIGADADMFVTDPTFQDIYLTSVLKGIKVATDEVVVEAGKGSLDFTSYIGTLANDGVGIADFHNFASKVSSTLQGELDTIKAGIIDGSIPVDSYLKS